VTRWLHAARQASEARTKLTEPTEPAPGLCGAGASATARGFLSVKSILSRGGRGTPEGLAPLDPEGLPFATCPACGGGLWWKDASLPLAGTGWACDACDPPPAGLWRHAVAVPVPVRAAQRGALTR
jgi:hypothetical protein